jgi:thiamine phosphate synthase YjbQ (UPF0047 family)
MAPTAIQLELLPAARCDVIDVARDLGAEARGFLERHRRTLYCSHHTTAGYLEQSLCARLDDSRERLSSLVDLFRRLFPPGANYQHDKLHLRRELSDEERRTEPRNADSHLAFIGSGLRSCVTYRNRPGQPVWFIDLDGVHEHGARRRRTTLLGYDREERVAAGSVTVPVSRHPIVSINLRDPRLGLYDKLAEWVRRHGVTHGRIDIALAREERHTGLTVNEYETLLMRGDLREVLEDPLRFMVERGRSLLRDPRSIANRTLDYARYDLPNLFNDLLDATGASESIVERWISRFLAVPAERFLRLKRAVSLPVLDPGEPGTSPIVQGRYQSPILIQWSRPAGGSRRLEIALYRFG